jgi:hypothetical protein
MADIGIATAAAIVEGLSRLVDGLFWVSSYSKRTGLFEKGAMNQGWMGRMQLGLGRAFCPPS